MIRKHISHSGFEKLKCIEGVSVTIPTVKGNLEIVTIYWSPTQGFQGRVLSEVLRNKLRTFGKNVIVWY